MLQKKRILITGGAGFIGSNLTERLLGQDNFVVCLDNFATGKKENIVPFLTHPAFKLIEGDIRDPDTCKKACTDIDIVLHQAAIGSVPRSIIDPATTNAVNINGFLNMLIAARDCGIKRFVYAASSSTYGDHPGMPKTEDTIGKPLSPYAVTKYVNELYANIFSDLYGIETIGLRYFNVFGKRQDPEGAYAAVIPKFIRMLIRHERPVVYGDGNQSRDFTYIDNVIMANELAATTNNRVALNTVFNVACGESTTVNELIFILKNQLSRFDPTIRDIHPDYQPVRVGDILHSKASVEKARSLLGYEPGFDIHKGMQLAIEWYWENLKHG